MDISRYRSIVRASAIYDLLVTFPFALPWLATWQISMLGVLHESFSLPGDMPEFSPLHLFFANLMGSVVVVWSVLRVHKPEALFGLYDSVARFLFSYTMLYYLLMENATALLWVLFIPEMIWGLVQFFGFWSLRDSQLLLKRSASSL